MRTLEEIVRINVSVPLNNFDGSPLVEADQVWTIGRALMLCTMCAPGPNEQRASEDQVWRYLLGKEIHDAQQTGMSDIEAAGVDITPEQAIALKKDATRLFGPIIAGPLSLALNGQ